MSSDVKYSVAYFYDEMVGNYHYGPCHPMKPHRIRMTHNLLTNYGLYKHMTVIRPPMATKRDLCNFHSDDYINFLQLITPDNMHEYLNQLHRFNVGEDCPVFWGMYQFSQISAGGSLAGAVKLNSGQSNIAINWAGGLHHAKRCEASGFCYINDAVLAILELLKIHARVLYIDIDIHHGDGVEEAFYTTDRVMTVSFHKYGDYFPGTGDIEDIGANKGKYYAVNFPLKDGIDDESYESIFKPVIGKVMEFFRPGAVVLQCGADSLTGDRLGCFNLSLKGHAECVRYVKSFNVPLLILGGGGYTIRNVSRCWTYETAVLLGKQLPEELPFNEYLEYYGPDYRLDIPPSNLENQNSREYLEKSKIQIFENLRHTIHAPSIPSGVDIPSEYSISSDEDEEDPDIRFGQKQMDSKVEHEGELYDSEDEDDRQDEILMEHSHPHVQNYGQRERERERLGLNSYSHNRHTENLPHWSFSSFNSPPHLPLPSASSIIGVQPLPSPSSISTSSGLGMKPKQPIAPTNQSDDDDENEMVIAE